MRLFYALMLGGMSSSASAQVLIDAGALLKEACQAMPAGDATPLPRERLAERLLASFNVGGSDVISELAKLNTAAAITPSSYSAMLIQMAGVQDNSPIQGAAMDLQVYLKNPPSKKPAARLADPSDPVLNRDNWLFSSDWNGKILCGSSRAPTTAVTTLAELAGKPLPRLGVVREVGSLTATGEDRQSAKSATIGFTNTVVRKADGSTKRTQLATVDATVGVRFTADKAQPMFLYANYTLNRSRVRPADTLKPGAFVDDADINVLETGVTAPDIDTGFGSLAINGGYVVDFVSDAERIRAQAVLTFGFKDKTFLGFCGLGHLHELSWLGDARVMCLVTLDADYGNVTRAPRAIVDTDPAPFVARGQFLSLGGSAGFQTAPPLNAKEGFVASVNYRYLKTVAGSALNIDRLDMALKYRWWLDSGRALDIGGAWKHGIEAKSYKVEDTLELSFGVLF
jgi:hypothetical protein